MILSLKNIGKVESAKVELNGITVIAGENDTGKSTIGKALYSIFNGFYKIECIITQLVLDAKRFILIPWLSFSITVLCAFQKAKNVNDRLQKKAFAYTIFAQYQCCVVAT